MSIKAYIQRSPLIDKQSVHVIDDVEAYIQKHVQEVHQVQHVINGGDEKDNTEN